MKGAHQEGRSQGRRVLGAGEEDGEAKGGKARGLDEDPEGMAQKLDIFPATTAGYISKVPPPQPTCPALPHTFEAGRNLAVICTRAWRAVLQGWLTPSMARTDTGGLHTRLHANGAKLAATWCGWASFQSAMTAAPHAR